MVKDGVREFVYDVDGPALLKRDLVWIDTGRSEFIIIHADWCPFKCVKSI